MSLQILTAGQNDQWDQLVKSFDNYDVYYLYSYAKAFQLHGDGDPILFYYFDEHIRAINVVMKRDIEKDKNFRGLIQPNSVFDITTPYGYGGFWVEGIFKDESIKKMNDEYSTYCRSENIVSEFVRFHLFSDYRDIFSGKVDSYTNNVVRSLDLDIDDMLLDFEHKVRKNLKKANEVGLEIEIDESGKRIEEFLDIYYSTMDRNQAKSNFYFTESFFKTINEMKGNFIYVHVIYENIVISTELVLFGSENCYSFLGGTKSDYFNLRPNDFLKFEIIKWAKNKGLKRFILGGGYGEDDGIFRYKKSFAPNGICKYFIGKRIFDEEKYCELTKIRNDNHDLDRETKYFPQYRG